MAAAQSPNPTTPQPLSSASTLSERTPDAETGTLRAPYAVHAYSHEHTDAVVVHDEENDNTGHGVSSWSQTDGPRRTMRKVSRRVLPLAAAAYGISGVRRECITYIHILRMVLLHVVRTALSCVLTEIVELTESRLCVFVSGRRSG